MTEITINIVELASNLAHNAMVDEMINKGLIIDEDDVWCTDEDTDDDCQYYTEKAQNIHTRYYDYFYSEILNCKTHA